MGIINEIDDETESRFFILPFVLSIIVEEDQEERNDYLSEYHHYCLCGQYQQYEQYEFVLSTAVAISVEIALGTGTVRILSPATATATKWWWRWWWWWR